MYVLKQFKKIKYYQKLNKNEAQRWEEYVY